MKKENLTDITQISTTAVERVLVTTALCEDGSVWQKFENSTATNEWECINKGRQK